MMKTGLTRYLVNHVHLEILLTLTMSKTLAIVILALSVMTTVVGQVNDGIAAFERGDKARAKLAFERTLKNDPRNVDAHTYLGMIAAE